MCQTIEANVILANLLRKNSEVTIRQLKEVRRQLETDIKGLYVDITLTSIIIAVETNPDMFELEDNTISRHDDKNFRDDYLEDCFNWRIPERMRTQVLEVLHCA